MRECGICTIFPVIDKQIQNYLSALSLQYRMSQILPAKSKFWIITITDTPKQEGQEGLILTQDLLVWSLKSFCPPVPMWFPPRYSYFLPQTMPTGMTGKMKVGCRRECKYKWFVFMWLCNKLVIWPVLPSATAGRDSSIPVIMSAG